MRRAADVTIDPSPPTVDGRLPWVGAGLSLLRDPTAFFADARRRHGDTFVVDAFGFKMFCVFSPDGVRRLYDVPEREASFGLATYRLIGFKLPPELLAGRRNGPHHLFGAQQVEGYLRTLEQAVDVEIAELGPQGRFDVFRECRRLGHRLGFACWAGVEAASPRYLNRLVALFDRIDSSEAFVRPASGFVTWATRRAHERRAMHGIEEVVTEIWDDRQRRGVHEDDFLDQLVDSYRDLPPEEQLVGAARDVIMLHVGAQSNLYAALAWTLVRVLEHPELLARIRAGDDDLLERCANEAIRMAQRSITLREVLTPIEIDDGTNTYQVGSGAFVTTMLSVTNTAAAPGLETFDPDHYVGRRLVADVPVATKELVSTFGHGTHSCPAARFSISAIRIAVRRLVETYDLIPEFHEVSPRRRQLGGVARAEGRARSLRAAHRGRRVACTTVPLDLAALLDPTHTAVVTMELQRGVVGEGAAIRELADVVAAHDVVDRAVDVVRAARAVGARVVHCTAEFRSDRAGSRDNSPLLHALAKGGPGPVAGSADAAVVAELGPEPSDLISPRSHGLTPFPGTGLDQILRNTGTRTIVATGVSLNVGVTGLVMVAVDLGYDVVVVTDAVAAMPWEYGAAVLEHTIAPLATRLTSADVIATWARLQRC